MAEPLLPEIETTSALEAALADGIPLRGRRIQDLDLTPYADALTARTDLDGLVVLGGRIPVALDAHLRAHGALVFPTDPHAPVNPYRSRLYTPQELYAGLAEQGYAATPDARAYAWLQDRAVAGDAFATLVRAIHDDSISDALTETLGDRPVVGVLGGHAVARGPAAYADAARLGRLLATAGTVVATGGGPGAMEAANLGACSGTSDLDASLRALTAVPGFVPDTTAWAALALRVRATLPPTDVLHSIGIPTWFYGHEPPNVFAQGIAKYFSNAIREDGLLNRCTAGLVVLPGAAGTVQEVFQAVTRLYYAAHEVPPLVLVDREHWTEVVPVWPALEALGRGRAMEGTTYLVDTVEEAAELVSP